MTTSTGQDRPEGRALDQAADAAPGSVAPQAFRDLMAGVCAPVTVVTTLDGETPVGTTVSSFASLSLEPPLVTVAFDRRSSVLAAILQRRRFGINLLGHGQEDLATRFAARVDDRFAGVGWHLSSGMPRLDGTAGWVVCSLREAVEGGDHLLLIGHVEKASTRTLAPLVYAHRTFGTHSGYSTRPRHEVIDVIAALSS